MMTWIPLPAFARRTSMGLAVVTGALLTGCATKPPKVYDYTAFKASKPASLLVLPPVNETPDVKASYSVLAQASLPLGEAGYYVLPVSLVDETFKENGLTSANEIQAVPVDKLREIFGADAAVYMTIKRYGSTYNVISSDTVATIDAKIVDLKSGETLWTGSATASSNEGQSSGQGGLAALLVKAVVSQIINSATDAGHKMAGVATSRLLTPNPLNGVLPGPRLKDNKQP